MTHTEILAAIKRLTTKQELEVLWQNHIWPLIAQQQVFYKHYPNKLELCLYDVVSEGKEDRILRWRYVSMKDPYIMFLTAPYEDLPLHINKASTCPDDLWKRVYMLRVSTPGLQLQQPKLAALVEAYNDRALEIKITP